MNRDARKSNKILIITYVFPPAAYVGVYRTLKYCKYLGDHGWFPIVLTINSDGAIHRNEALCEQIPDHVEVYRTFNIDPANWLDALSRLKKDPGDRISQSGTVNERPQLGGPGIWKKLKRLVIALLTNSPDSHIFWAPFAFFKGFRILLKEKIDVIYCTSPPHSSHIVAFLLARCFRKPYVLDFRDPWYVGASAQIPSEKLSWVLKLEARAKRRIVSGAATVICASKGERKELWEEFPEIEPERFAFITNGYDPADFSRVTPEGRATNKLTLTHTGTIYGGTAGEFLGALLQLLRERPGIEDMIQVQLLGEISQEYSEIIRALESKGIMQTYGVQPHATALRMTMESDVAVILLGGNTFPSSEIPAKVFEYLFTGKPILAIAEEGELTEILRQSGLGIIVRPQSADSVADVLRDLVADHAAGRLTRVPNRSYIRSFERAVLTEKLARVLDAVKGAELVRQ